MPSIINGYPFQVLFFDERIRSATPDIEIVTARNGGVHLMIKVTNAPGGGQTLVPTIYGVNYFDGLYPLLTGNAITATGEYLLKIAPGLLSIPGVVASDFVPDKWGVGMLHSGAGPWTYSASANLRHR